MGSNLSFWGFWLSFLDKFCQIMQQYVNTVAKSSSHLVDINGDVNHEQRIWKTHIITKEDRHRLWVVVLRVR